MVACQILFVFIISGLVLDYGQCLRPFETIRFSFANNDNRFIANIVSCNETQLTYCTSFVLKALNFTTLPSYAKFAQAVDTRLMLNKQSFEQVCNSTNNYVTCVGPDNFDNCLSTGNLLQFAANPTDAANYAADAYGLRFECVTDFSIFDSNFDCLQADAANITACVIKYQADLKKTPNDTCTPTQDYTDCYSNVFANCGSDLVTAVCQQQQVSFGQVYPNCSITCTNFSHTFKPSSILLLIFMFICMFYSF